MGVELFRQEARLMRMLCTPVAGSEALLQKGLALAKELGTLFVEHLVCKDLAIKTARKAAPLGLI